MQTNSSSILMGHSRWTTTKECGSRGKPGDSGDNIPARSAHSCGYVYGRSEQNFRGRREPLTARVVTATAVTPETRWRQASDCWLIIESDPSPPVSHNACVPDISGTVETRRCSMVQQGNRRVEGPPRSTGTDVEFSETRHREKGSTEKTRCSAATGRGKAR